MKPILIILFLVTAALPSKGQTPLPSAVFSYDAAGNRVERNYGIAVYKNGSNVPIDTFKQQFGEEHYSNSDLIVKSYPNPVDNILIVENFNWEDKDQVVIKLYDLSGKLTLSRPVTKAKEQIPFQGIAAGTYQVHYYRNNRLLTMWKVVKL